MKFYKLSGTGNDFIVIDNRGNIFPTDKREKIIKKMCERNRGIGADGLILIENSGKSDFNMVFYNNDGSRAEMCGNGGRCISYMAHYLGIAPPSGKFESLAGIHEYHVLDNEIVEIELVIDDKMIEDAIEYKDVLIDYMFMNTGVPHVVILTGDINNVDVVDVGRYIRYHDKFKPSGTNVNFVQIKDHHNILIRTYERGVEDETLACGTGSTAAAISLYKKNMVKLPVSVNTRGGDILTIDIRNNKVFLKGRVDFIYTGETGKYYEEDFHNR